MDGMSTTKTTLRWEKMEPQPHGDKIFYEPEYPGGPAFVSSPLDSQRQVWRCPHPPGSRVPVRESWYEDNRHPVSVKYANVIYASDPHLYCYDQEPNVVKRCRYLDEQPVEKDAAQRNMDWHASRETWALRPAETMPLWAVRRWELVISCRAVQAKDVSENDAARLGFGYYTPPYVAGGEISEPDGEMPSVGLERAAGGPDVWLWLYETTEEPAHA